MKFKMKNILFLLPLLLFSCEDKAKNLKEEVLAIHDEVMPKMGDLRRTRKDLMLRADSIISVDSLRAEKLLSASAELASATERMMSWMRNYDPEFSGTDEEILQYLAEQKESISNVRNRMLEAQANGQEMLGNDK